MDWEMTIGAFAVAAIITVWANIASRRPRTLGRVPLIPPDVIQLISIIALFILGAHLITLYRGEPLNIRSRF